MKRLTKSVDFLVNYLEEFPGTTGAVSNSYFKVIRDGGTITNANIEYDVTFGSITLDAPTEATPKPAKTVKATDVSMVNNTYTSNAPLKISIGVTFKKNIPSGELTDTLIIEHYRPALANFGETGDQKIGTYKVLIKYSSGDTYTVSIPTEVNVPFNDTKPVKQDVTVNHNMQAGATLEVGLSDTNDYLMKLDPTGLTNPPTDAKIAYSADFPTAGNKKTTINGTGAEVLNLKHPVAVTVTADEWKQAYVNNYKDDTMTFYVTYTPKPTT